MHIKLISYNSSLTIPRKVIILEVISYLIFFLISDK